LRRQTMDKVQKHNSWSWPLTSI